MCFYISNKKSENTIRTANRNIVCYKVGSIVDSMLGDVFQSRIMRFNYWFDIEYKIKGKFKIRKTNIYFKIDEAFHSLTNLITAMNESDSNNRKPQIVKCIIPKGAKYYVNSDHKEYVSNRIIIKEMVKA